MGAGTGALNGRSEQLLGQFVKEAPVSDAARSNVCIATKLAAYPWRLTSGASPFEFESELEADLFR